jgi:hypothetical protein
METITEYIPASLISFVTRFCTWQPITQLAQLRCGDVVRTFAERGDNVGIISCSNVFL